MFAVEQAISNEEPSPVIPGQVYQNLVLALQTDPKCANEVALSRRVGFYRFCGEIGRGNFSRVKLAIHQITRDKVAIKIVDRGRLENRALRMLSREIATLECVHHPNILRLYEVIETLGRVYLVTEWIQGGELYNRITEDGPLAESYAARLFKQLLLAVQHMHNLGFVHRDIKAENVLLVTENWIKLADFGFSTQLLIGSQQRLDTFCGSPPYAAPELFSDDHYIGGPVDVWALGVLLYFMVIGNMPFRAPNVPALRSAVLKGEYSLPSLLTLPYLRLIQRILVHVPSNRPSIEQMLNSQWILEAPFIAVVKSQPIKKQPYFSRNRKNYKHESCHVNLAQLHFNTQKSNNVMESNFLHPIDNRLLADEIVTLQNKRDISTITHNKSFFNVKFKKKIGPMEEKTKEKLCQRNIDISANCRNVRDVFDTNILVDAIQAKSTTNCASNLVDDIDSGLNEIQGDFLMFPTPTSDLTNLDSLETETRIILLKLGITDDMLYQAIKYGPRSDIIGTYRIVIHRLQKHQLHVKQTAVMLLNEQPIIPKCNHQICAIL